MCPRLPQAKSRARLLCRSSRIITGRGRRSDRRSQTKRLRDQETKRLKDEEPESAKTDGDSVRRSRGQTKRLKDQEIETDGGRAVKNEEVG